MDQVLDYAVVVSNYLNDNPAVVIVIASLLAIGLQALVNRYVEFGKYTNRLLALTAYPNVAGLGAAFVAGLPPKYLPLVAVLSQVVYATHQAYKKRLLSSQVQQPEVAF